MHLLFVIPARLGSTRLSHKPLRRIAGDPMIRVAARNALALDLGARVVVAADDPRILAAVADLPVYGMLTSSTHDSGTARVGEVARHPVAASAEVMLNLQGDEPFVPREAALGAIDQVLGGAEVGTVAQPVTAVGWRDPHRVKVEVDARGRALRFYRTPAARGCVRPDAVFQHVGVYAYRPAALRRWLSLPPVPEEVAERLEQLRPLAHGMTVGVAVLPTAVPDGVDTTDDLRRVEAMR